MTASFAEPFAVLLYSLEGFEAGFAIGGDDAFDSVVGFLPSTVTAWRLFSSVHRFAPPVFYPPSACFSFGSLPFSFAKPNKSSYTA